MEIKKAAMAAAAGVLVVMASPATAAPSLVTVDGDSSNTDHPFTAVTKGAVAFSSGNVTFGCTGATAAGNVHGGTGANPVASISSMAWAGCRAWSNLELIFSMKPGGNPQPWHINAYSGYTSAPDDHNVIGEVGNVYGKMTSGNPLIPCSFEIVGSVDSRFDEKVLKVAGPPAVYGQDLIINENSGNLILQNVSGCLGLFSNGDPANFAATFNIHVTGAASQTPINVQP